MRHCIFGIIFLFLASCLGSSATAQRLRRRATPVPPPEPVPLFDGQTLNGWVTANGEPVTEGWLVEDGILQLMPLPDRRAQILRSLLPRHIAHQFDAADTSEIISPRFDFGRGGQCCHAP